MSIPFASASVRLSNRPFFGPFPMKLLSSIKSFPLMFANGSKASRPRCCEMTKLASLGERFEGRERLGFKYNSTAWESVASSKQARTCRIFRRTNDVLEPVRLLHVTLRAKTYLNYRGYTLYADMDGNMDIQKNGV